MSMKEQKLFFTRHGKYSEWEMLRHLDENFLVILHNFVFEKQWAQTSPGRPEEYPSFLYRVYQCLPEADQVRLFEEIKKYFIQMDPPKSDFHAYMYYFGNTAFDLVSTETNLNQLHEKIDEFEVENLTVEYWADSDSEFGDIIDIRFTSPRALFYKANENIQIVNTEMRFYLKLGIALMTNFTQYTHSDAEKKSFIDATIKLVSSYRSAIEPIKMSDQSLRNLLMMGKKLPSKVKFEVEGRMKVGLDIYQTEDFHDFVSQDEIKYFYDKFPLSMLKVKISEGEEEKYLSIDGLEGKLLSRSHNIDVVDIDSFIKRLSVLLQHDYLNHNYETEIKQRATRELTGIFTQKNNYVYASYRAVENKISEICMGASVDVTNLLRNAFFFCINKNIFPTNNEVKYTLDAKTVSIIAKVSRSTSEQVNSLFDGLIIVFENHPDDFAALMFAVDDFIKQL